ncbi:ABC-2 family transporter protein [compost metagenome]
MAPADEVITGIEMSKEIISESGLGQFIVFLAMIATAGAVAQEHSLGTIKFLLIRAQSRSTILASKYAAVILYTLCMVVSTLIVAFIAGGIAFGFDATKTGWGDLLLAALSTWVYMLVYVTITFMIGVLTRSTGTAIGIGMAIVLLQGAIVMLLSKYDFIKYVLFTNTSLSVYWGDGNPPVQGMTLAFSVIVLAAYMILFLGASFVTFRKRDIA